MNACESVHGASREAKQGGLLRRLRCWWRPQDSDEKYLAAATDHADLERRMRVLERASAGSAFVTFNH